MTQQLINLGQADKGNGDPLRTAFDKINQNFNELYAQTGDDIQIPAQATHTGKVLTTNGTALSWGTVSYTSLTDKPAIPTSFSSLVNGAHSVSLGTDGTLTLPLNGDIKAGVTEEVGTILYDINFYDTFETVFLDLDTNLAYTWNVAQQSLLDVGADLVGWKFRGENFETLYTVIDAVVNGSSLTLTTENTIPTAPMDMLVFYSPDYLAKQTGPLNLVVDDKTLSIGTDGNITLPLNGEIRSRIVAQVGTGSSITAPGWTSAAPGEAKARWWVGYWAAADLVAIGTDLVGWVFNPIETNDYYTVTTAEIVDDGGTLELTFAERSLPGSLATVAYTVRSPGYFERQASDITLVADANTWTFGNDGNLTLPAGFVTSNEVTGVNLRSGYDVSIISNHMDVDREWIFGSDGSLTFPDSTVQTTAYPGIPGPYADDAAAALANVAVGSPYYQVSGQVFVRLV